MKVLKVLTGSVLNMIKVLTLKVVKVNDFLIGIFIAAAITSLRKLILVFDLNLPERLVNQVLLELELIAMFKDSHC